MGERYDLSQLFTGAAEEEPKKEVERETLSEEGDDFETYRRELLESMRSMAVLGAELEDWVINYPETTATELREEFEHRTQGEPMTNEMRQVAKQLIDGYGKQHETITDYTDNYTDNDLYAKIFGRRPYGPVQVFAGPVSLNFVCLDLRDYERLYEGIFSDEMAKITEGKKSRAEKSGGVSLNNAPFPELKGVINGENASVSTMHDPEITDHEDRHVKQRLVGIVCSRAAYEKKLAEATDPEQRRRYYFQLFSYFRDALSEHDVLNEMLAYIKDGSSNRQIVATLTKTEGEGGLYDFHSAMIEELKKKYSDDELANEMIEQVFKTDHKRMLMEALNAFDEMSDHLKLSTNEAIELVQRTPVKYWPNLMRRFKKYDYVPEFMGGRLVRKEDRYWKDFDCTADEFDKLGRSRPKQSNKKSGTR